MKLNHWVVLVAGSALATITIAKLPTPVLTEEQKAKVEEAKAKAADAAKKDSADLARYQDRVADKWFAESKKAGKSVPPSTWVPPAPQPAAATPVAPIAPTTPVTPAKKA
jgi:hypothetical protein